MYYDIHRKLAFDFAFVVSTDAKRFSGLGLRGGHSQNLLLRSMKLYVTFFLSRFESCCLVLFCIYNHLLAVLVANEHIVFTKMCELF